MKPGTETARLATGYLLASLTSTPAESWPLTARGWAV